MHLIYRRAYLFDNKYITQCGLTIMAIHGTNSFIHVTCPLCRQDETISISTLLSNRWKDLMDE